MRPSIHFPLRCFYQFLFIFFFLAGLLPSSVWARQVVAFATLAPKSSTWGQLIREIAREVYKETDKQILFKVFYGGVQGDEAEMEAKIRFGQLQGGFFTGNGLGLVAPQARILEVPGLIKTYTALDYVYERFLPALTPYFEKRGYALLGLTEVGYAYFFSKKNVSSIEALGETKMWIWKGDELVTKAMKLYGIPGIAVHFTEVIPSLKTGLIDGVYSTPTALVSLQWHREVAYMLDFPLTLVSSGVVLSKKSWQQFSAKQQTLVSRVVTEQLVNFKAKLRATDRETLQLLRQFGIRINSPNYTPAQVAALESKTRGLLEDFPPSLRDRLLTVLSAAPK